jgi:hypothetical protein
LTSIVAYDEVTEEQKTKAEHTKTRIVHYSDVIKEGEKHE